MKCFSFDSLANLATTKKVVSEVRSIYGKKKWTKAIIRSKCLFTENVLFFAGFFFLTYFAKNTYSSKLTEKRLGRTTVNQKSIRERVLLFSLFRRFFFSYVLCKKYIFQQARGKALRAHNSTVNQKSIRERVLLFSNFSINLTDSPFYYKLPFNILFYYFMEIKTSKISGHS